MSGRRESAIRSSSRMNSTASFPHCFSIRFSVHFISCRYAQHPAGIRLSHSTVVITSNAACRSLIHPFWPRVATLRHAACLRYDCRSPDPRVQYSLSSLMDPSVTKLISSRCRGVVHLRVKFLRQESASFRYPHCLSSSLSPVAIPEGL